MIEKDIDRDGQLKLYVQIYGIIKRMIEEGEWPPNSLIPSDDELGRMFSVSKVTVRLALTDLERDGYLSRHQGRGTFVKSPLPSSGITMKTRLNYDTFRADVHGCRETLEAGIRRPEEVIKEHLSYDGDIFYARCRDSEDGEPTCIEELFAPLIFFPGIEGADISGSSFFSLVRERCIRKLSKIVQKIEVVRVEDTTAGLLLVRKGDPALLMHRVVIDADSRPLAYMRLCGKGGKYRIEVEFERIK